MKYILVVLLAVFLLLQFFPIDTTNPVSSEGMDFIQAKNTPESTAVLIKAACYDCHSNQTRYPWYTRIQPVGWWMKDHIREGRVELNFSVFSTYSPERQAHKLSEAVEKIETGEMPLESYLLTHPEAKLTPEQKQELTTYFKKMESDIRYSHNLPFNAKP